MSAAVRAPSHPGRHDIPAIAGLTLLTSAAYYGIQELLWRVVEPFDSSHLINTTATSPGLRWDALHFLAIATGGYTHEQQVAFQPGWQGLLHVLGMGAGNGGDDAILRAAVIVNTLMRMLANVYLYKLTRALFERRTALVASVLYAFPPAPAVLSAPYTEVTYALFTFLGFYLLTNRKWLRAALSFAVATSVRATGVFTVIPLAYVLLIPLLDDKFNLTRLASRVILTGVLSLIIISPFLAFQGWTWRMFCMASTRPWCAKLLPSSYSFVQAEYWNIGFLKYWRLEQVPNFILAAPVLYISILGIYTYKTSTWPIAKSDNHTMAAIVTHQTLINALLLFSSHTQIALRLAPTDPVMWWTLASSLVTGRKVEWWHTMWGWWVCLWGAASLVLWTGHYPPA